MCANSSGDEVTSWPPCLTVKSGSSYLLELTDRVFMCQFQLFQLEFEGTFVFLGFSLGVSMLLRLEFQRALRGSNGNAKEGEFGSSWSVHEMNQSQFEGGTR